MARFLMGWEFGGGLGHVGRMAPLAKALSERGHQVDVVLKEVALTQAMFRPTPVRVFQAPVWMHRVSGLPQPPISLTEIILGAGYHAADTLQALIQPWRALMQVTEADAVIADYAPTAVLAARIAGLPTASLGIGFYVPPDEAPLPPFRTWEPIQAGRVAHHDQQVLEVVNEVMHREGAPPVQKLADLFRGDRPLLCTWPELDPYGRRDLPPGQRYFGPCFSPSAGTQAVWPDGAGPQVFAYLRHDHPGHLAVLQALVDRGCRTLVYMPEVSHGQPPPLTSPRLRYSSGPVQLDSCLSNCALLVCHAGAGTLNEALLAGVPVLMLPTQAEQFLVAMRVQEAGAGLNAAQQPQPVQFGAMIDALLNQASHRQAARAFAAQHASFSHTRQTAELVSEFEALLRT